MSYNNGYGGGGYSNGQGGYDRGRGRRGMPASQLSFSYGGKLTPTIDDRPRGRGGGGGHRDSGRHPLPETTQTRFQKMVIKLGDEEVCTLPFSTLVNNEADRWLKGL